MFADRPNPSATRMHFALASIEDAVLADVETALGAIPGVAVNAYMFDGAIARVPQAEVDSVAEALRDLGGRWGISFSVS
eukprot:4948707-Alexandrium_andersonii.AAC.1